MQIAMISDRILPFAELDPAYLDRGVFFGDGVYEVIRSYDGKIFALAEHLERFANSMRGIGITGVDIDLVRSRVLKAFEEAGIADAKIYFHVTRGSEPRSHVSAESLKPNFFLTVTELESHPEAKTNGVSVSTHPDWRWARCDIKSLNLLANVLAREDAAKKGNFEAILVDSNGLITEGAASAFFAVVDGTLRTAPLTANILPSVTRRFVLKAAENRGLQVEEKSLTVPEAIGADELFIAVTTQDILPIVRFDGQAIGDGKPGSTTGILTEEFNSFRQ
jgi:D-alanine transaminase